MTQRWGSRVGLILAMAGNAVGLGNFLRFPAQAIQHGGGAFLVPYLVCFLLMGIPLLWVEWAIGRHGGQFGHHSTPGMFDTLGRSSALKYAGVFGLFTTFTVAAYYLYIEAWTLAYVYHSVVGTFATEAPSQFFSHLVGNVPGEALAVPVEGLFWFTITLLLNMVILSQGLVRGVERSAKIGLPLLIVFAGFLVVKGLTLSVGDTGVIVSPLEGLNYIWEPQVSGLTDPSTWLAAAGQVFFTLSLGMGSIHCYASYLRENEDIALNASAAGWLNELVEVVLGGSLIIPISVAYLGLASVSETVSTGGGFSLGFLTMPTLFSNWGWLGPVAGAMWFGLLFFAGITSSLAMGQPLLTFLEDEFGMRRTPATVTLGISLFCLGFVAVWLYPLGAFDEFDFWSGTFALVVFGLAESLVFSFVFGMDKGWAEIKRGSQLAIPGFFRPVIQWVTPGLLLFVFLGSLVKPANDWFSAFASLLSGAGWPLANDSILGMLLHVGQTGQSWFSPDGHPTHLLVKDLSRALLLTIFAGISLMVWHAWKRRKKGLHD